MKRYLLRRLIGLLPTLLLISIAVFSITRVLPGDPAAMLAASDEGVIDPQLRAFITEKYGLDDPLVTQYWRWMWGVVRGEWGDSFFSGVGVFEQIRTRAGFTLQLAILSWLTALLIGIPLGVASALRRNSIGDMAATSFAVAGIALPNFWLGMLMIILFAVMLGWLPTGGYTPISESPVLWAKGMVMPTIALGTALSAGIMRLTRSALLEVLMQDYVRTAGEGPGRAAGHLAAHVEERIAARRNAVNPSARRADWRNRRN